MNALERDKREIEKSRVVTRINQLLTVPMALGGFAGIMSATQAGYVLATVTLTILAVGQIFDQCLQMARLKYFRQGILAMRDGANKAEEPRFKAWHGSLAAVIESTVLIIIVVVLSLANIATAVMVAMLASVIQGWLTLRATQQFNQENMRIMKSMFSEEDLERR